MNLIFALLVTLPTSIIGIITILLKCTTGNGNKGVVWILIDPNGDGFNEIPKNKWVDS